MAESRRAKIYDDLLQLNDTIVATTTSAAGTIDGTAKIVDLGGYTEGTVVLDVSATTEAFAAADGQWLEIILQGSTSATFAAPGTNKRNLATIGMGANGIRSGGQGTWDATSKRVILPFNNEHNGTVYRYVRISFRTLEITFYFFPTCCFWISKL